MFAIFAADSDRHNSLCAQTYDRAKRLLQAYTTVPEKCRSFRSFEFYRLKHQRDGGRCENMIDGNFGRKGNPAASVPHRVPFLSLQEQVTLAGVIVCRGDRKS